MPVTVAHYKYNKNLHASCKKLCAKFQDGVWIFDDAIADKAAKLKEIWEGELVLINIIAKEDIEQWCNPVYFAGYEICKASGRDSGAKISSKVYGLSGTIGSGGSRCNWTTCVEKGSTFRLQILKSALKKASESKFWNVALVDLNSVDADAAEEDEEE